MSAAARAAIVIVLVAAAGAGYWWWNRPERQIQRLLDGLAEALSHDQPGEGLGAIAAVAGLQPYFAPDVVVQYGSPAPMTGRESVLAAAARVRAAVPALRVRFVDVRIDVAPGASRATVDCTVSASLTDRAGQERVDAREVKLEVARREGRWVVERAETVTVLEPVM